MMEFIPLLQNSIDGVQLAITVLILWRLNKVEKNTEKLQNDHIEIGKSVAVLMDNVKGQ